MSKIFSSCILCTVDIPIIISHALVQNIMEHILPYSESIKFFISIIKSYWKRRRTNKQAHHYKIVCYFGMSYCFYVCHMNSGNFAYNRKTTIINKRQNLCTALLFYSFMCIYLLLYLRKDFAILALHPIWHVGSLLWKILCLNSYVVLHQRRK